MKYYKLYIIELFHNGRWIGKASTVHKARAPQLAKELARKYKKCARIAIFEP